MKKRGSCGLKQARYDTSWRLFAARCLLVQNSLTSVSTTIGRLASPMLVTVCSVRRPFQLNARSSAATAGAGRASAGSRWTGDGMRLVLVRWSG
jgi:hypothetical protein